MTNKRLIQDVKKFSKKRVELGEKNKKFFKTKLPNVKKTKNTTDFSTFKEIAYECFKTEIINIVSKYNDDSNDFNSALFAEAMINKEFAGLTKYISSKKTENIAKNDDIGKKEDCIINSKKLKELNSLTKVNNKTIEDKIDNPLKEILQINDNSQVEFACLKTKEVKPKEKSKVKSKRKSNSKNNSIITNITSELQLSFLV